MTERRRGLEPRALKMEEETASQEIQAEAKKAESAFPLRPSRRNRPR